MNRAHLWYLPGTGTQQNQKGEAGNPFHSIAHLRNPYHIFTAIGEQVCYYYNFIPFLLTSRADYSVLSLARIASLPPLAMINSWSYPVDPLTICPQRKLKINGL